jgi:DNA-binding response OmpR family regulator
MRILIIEDELRMLELLSKGLYEAGYTVMTAVDGETGLAAALAHEFDAIVLDIGLPRRDGYSVAQAIRSTKPATPILMLTARDTEDDIIRGLDTGADDYMTKPFSFAELVARLHSITRPRYADVSARMDGVAGLVVDHANQRVMRNDTCVHLTRTEFALLTGLLRNPGRCVSRQMLTTYIWGADPDVSPGALDVLVNGLRRKIDEPFQNKMIYTVRGQGYTLKAQPAAAASAN